MPRYQEPQVQATNHRQNHESPRKGPPSPKKDIKVNLKLLYFYSFVHGVAPMERYKRGCWERSGSYREVKYSKISLLTPLKI